MNMFDVWEAFEDVRRSLSIMSSSISILQRVDDPSKLHEGLSLMQDNVTAMRAEIEVVCRILRDEAAELFKTGAVSITRGGGETDEGA